ncbi:MAG: hypothetical protein ABIG20_03830 [archaeon]
MASSKTGLTPEELSGFLLDGNRLIELKPEHRLLLWHILAAKDSKKKFRANWTRNSAKITSLEIARSILELNQELKLNLTHIAFVTDLLRSGVADGYETLTLRVSPRAVYFFGREGCKKLVLKSRRIWINRQNKAQWRKTKKYLADMREKLGNVITECGEVPNAGEIRDRRFKRNRVPNKMLNELNALKDLGNIYNNLYNEGTGFLFTELHLISMMYEKEIKGKASEEKLKSGQERVVMLVNEYKKLTGSVPTIRMIQNPIHLPSIASDRAEKIRILNALQTPASRLTGKRLSRIDEMKDWRSALRRLGLIE